MFIHPSAFSNARAIDITDLGGEVVSIHELAEEWQRHIFRDEDHDAI
ncbi:hypothetical protein C8J31_101170 [Rhizobium sp. PP-CC-2G-626]|nr:hypothetical protein C8J31_101170 [Rhizobium sp. PP-CC-2G-626]